MAQASLQATCNNLPILTIKIRDPETGIRIVEFSQTKKNLNRFTNYVQDTTERLEGNGAQATSD